MNSFYGGQQGISFQLSKIFRNKVELASDLQLKWQSTISVGEYVLIAYGRPNITEYEAATGASPLFADTEKELLKTKTFSRSDSSLINYVPSSTLLELGDYCKYDSSNYYLCIQHVKTNDEVTGYVLEYHTASPKYGDNVNTDTTAYGKIYNGTVWQKIYRETTDSTTIAELEGIETFFGSESYGFGYKLITSISGNTPKIGVNDTQVIGPSELPSVAIDASNIDEPKLTFSLPRMIDFEYGTELSYGVTPYVITGKAANWMKVGDVYINSSYGHIFTVASIAAGTGGYDYTFTYNGCMAGPVAAENVYKNPFILNTQTGNYEWDAVAVERKTYASDPTVSYYEFTNLTLPVLNENVTWIGSTESAAASLTPISTTELEFKFNIPQGAKYYVGDYTVAPTGDQLAGDFLIDQNTSELYQAVKSGSTLSWQDTGFAMVGTGLSFILNDNVDYEDVEFSPYDMDQVVPYIKALMTAAGIETIKPNELVSLTWSNIPSSVGAGNGTYWYNCKKPSASTIAEQGWSAMLVAANISFLVKTRTTGAQAENVAYTASYVNDLISNGTIASDKKSYTTYSASVIEDLLSWGSF